MKSWFSDWVSVGHGFPGVRLGGSVGRAPVRRDGEPGTNPGLGENFFIFKLASVLLFIIVS